MNKSGLTGWKRFLFIFFTLILVTAGGLLVLANIYTGDTLRKGISIENTDVSWMSAEEARELVSERIKKEYPEQSITLRYEDKTWELKLDEIDYGFKVDDAVKQAFSIARTGNFFKDLYNAVLLSVNKQNLNIGINYNRDKIKTLLKKIKKE